MDEFYTLTEILSKKSEKGLFGYKKEYDYTAFGYTLYNIVFDMTELGKDPIKLVRSILLYVSIAKLEKMHILELLFDIFLLDVSTHVEVHFSNESRAFGLIYVLSEYSKKEKVEEVAMTLLAEFLGATYYSHKKSTYKLYRSDVLTLQNVDYVNLIKLYNKYSKIFRYHVNYCNAIDKYKNK